MQAARGTPLTGPAAGQQDPEPDSPAGLVSGRQLWRVGLLVAVALFVGALPCFVGLILVLPVLGHSTWHLYRRVVRS